LLLLGGIGNFRGLEPAQFIGIGKFVEILQSEHLKKQLSSLVKKRAAWLLGAPRHADDLTLQQGGKHAIHGNTAHRLNLRTTNRLAIGNDGQGFQAGLAQARGLGGIKEAIRPDRVIRTGLELIAACDPLDHEAGSLLGQLGIQLFDGLLDFIGSYFFEGSRFGRRRKSCGVVQGTRNRFGCEGSIRDK